MNRPDQHQYVLFGGTFILANKLQLVADNHVEGLSTKQWFLLRTLRDMPTAPTPTISALAKESDTSRQNVTKMLEALERQGCVTLCISPDDRRSRTVTLTEHGHALLSGMAAAAAPFFDRLFSGIGEEDCATAANVLVHMLENLGQMQKAAP